MVSRRVSRLRLVGRRSVLYLKCHSSWEWNETEDSEPVVMIESYATFTGMYDGAVDLTAPVPDTPKIGVWRIEPDGHYTIKGLMDDPIVTAAAEQAARN